MCRSVRHPSLLLVALLVVALTGCRRSPSDALATVTVAALQVVPGATATLAPTITPPASATPSPTPSPTPDLFVTSRQEVGLATLQIEAQGAFFDPESNGYVNTAGRGSGFLIDPSGLAVTNNHVVTGAAFIHVWIGQERQPRRATILGVAECADLAVIDVEGEGYRALEWEPEPIVTGQEVFAAGFPLGEPEYTLTRGIVTSDSAEGDSAWASLSSTIQHDALIRRGNSGGPLVTAQGKVVGINYGGISDADAYFAISAAEARPVIEQLRAGNNVDSIGINGRAIRQAGLTGIWVSSVRAGSPADRAGLTGGDMILSLERFALAQDGTMHDFCATLRTHQSNLVLHMEALHTGSGERFTSRLEGVVTNGPDVAEEQSTSEATPPAATASTLGYGEITDDSGLLRVRVPLGWNEVRGSGWGHKGEIVGPALYASPAIDAMLRRAAAPGLFFGASSVLAGSETPLSLLDDQLLNGMGTFCTFAGRSAYDDNQYVGSYDRYTDCKGTDTEALVIAAEPAGGAFLVLVIVYLTEPEQLEAYQEIVRSFQVVGEVP